MTTNSLIPSFCLFIKLPVELQDMIWGLLLLKRRVIKLETFPNWPYPNVTRMVPQKPRPNTSLMHTCQRSRLLAIQHYEKCKLPSANDPKFISSNYKPLENRQMIFDSWSNAAVYLTMGGAQAIKSGSFSQEWATHFRHVTLMMQEVVIRHDPRYPKWTPREYWLSQFGNWSAAMSKMTSLQTLTVGLCIGSLEKFRRADTMDYIREFMTMEWKQHAIMVRGRREMSSSTLSAEESTKPEIATQKEVCKIVAPKIVFLDVQKLQV